MMGTSDETVDERIEPAASAGPSASESAKGVEESIQFAKKYLEDLLSFFGLNTDVYATTEDNEVIELHVPSTQYNAFLIGQHGDTMRSLQYIVSTALKNNDYQVSRINVDVADYKKARAERLMQTAEDWVKQVVSSGEPLDLMPMNAADRRIIHKLASDNGLLTESVGEGRERHVVLRPGDNNAPMDNVTAVAKDEVEAPEKTLATEESGSLAAPDVVDVDAEEATPTS